MPDQDPKYSGLLRVSLQDQVLQELLRQYPKLSRTEISDVISRHGPMRDDVEAQLTQLSNRKR